MKRMISMLCAVLLMLAAVFSLAACDEEQKKEEGDGDKAGSIFAVTYRGVTIELGKDAEKVLEELGEATSSAKVASCGEGAGDQWQYVYPSIYLFTVKNGDSEIIDGVALRDDTAETTKKITVGSDASEVTKAYGEATVNGQKHRYTKGNYTLEFQIEDGKVSVVELRTEN